MSSSGGKFKQLFKKYGKVAAGVHLSISGASIAGLYVSIKNNVDVESVFSKLHLPGFSSEDPPLSKTDLSPESSSDPGLVADGAQPPVAPEKKFRSRTAELASSSGGALALALICNKALIPVRIPITIVLTPPIARFLARRNIMKTGV